MKTVLKKITAINVVLPAVALALVLFAGSCKKTGSSPDFAGTYYGTFTYGLLSEADTIIVTDSTANVIKMLSKTSKGSSYTIIGNTSGAKLNIASQQIFDSYSNTTYTVNGTGTLSNNNNSLLINYDFISGSTNYYWSFSGTKP